MPTSKSPAPPRRRRIFISHTSQESEEFRFYLKEWRQFRGMSQEDLADALKTSKGEVSRYERGHRALSLLVQFRLARALSISPAQLFSHPDVKSADALLANLSPDDRERYLAALATLIGPQKPVP